MQKAFQYRIYLTHGQRRILEQQLEAYRWVYNETLAERKRAYQERGEHVRLYDTHVYEKVRTMSGSPASKATGATTASSIPNTVMACAWSVSG